jgi:hypothetical protein
LGAVISKKKVKRRSIPSHKCHKFHKQLKSGANRTPVFKMQIYKKSIIEKSGTITASRFPNSQTVKFYASAQEAITVTKFPTVFEIKK